MSLFKIFKWKGILNLFTNPITEGDILAIHYQDGYLSRDILYYAEGILEWFWPFNVPQKLLFEVLLYLLSLQQLDL